MKKKYNNLDIVNEIQMLLEDENIKLVLEDNRIYEIKRIK